MINILLCTSGNLKNLRRCVFSISKINYKKKINLFLINNSKNTLVKNILTNTKFKKNFNIFYKNEKKGGIPNARNASINLSRKLKSDYTCFFDDDCIIPKNWLTQMIKIKDLKLAKIITGPQVPLSNNIYEKVIARNEKHMSEVKWAATNNVFISSQVLKKEKIFFDMDLLNIGGSDQLFFLKLSKKYKILWNEDAKVYEMSQNIRKNFMWFFYRNIRFGSSSFIIYRKNYNLYLSIIICCVKSLKELLVSIISLVNIFNFKYSILKSIQYITRSIATFFSIFGFVVKEYK